MLILTNYVQLRIYLDTNVRQLAGRLRYFERSEKYAREITYLCFNIKR